jgi:uncharacterized integral membrane protein (TIGR00698 family)
MSRVPGLLLAFAIALVGAWSAEFIGVTLMGLPKSPISGIMMAIVIGILIRNTLGLSGYLQPGITFSVLRMLRLGIVLLGIRISLGEAGAIGLKAVPIVLCTVPAALVVVTFVARRMGLSDRLGTLIAVGTGICGATAIVATAPIIAAREEETSYAVACIALFGSAAMLSYPYLAHWILAADPFRIGLFLGTAVHDTSQVAGSGLVYQQFFDDPKVLDVATVTKLVRNLGMLVVIPLMSVYYHRRSSAGGEAPAWYTMVPLFVIGFAVMSLVRTLGDSALPDQPVFGFLTHPQWSTLVGYSKLASEYSLAIAMAGVGLSTGFANLKSIGFKPLFVGLLSAIVVGTVSLTAISLIY